ncbi:MAG: UDP-N-acetylmuramoyl-tripeptide--D-alanyl-D-alanine ligase [Caulobacterales bacterium]|nr:UDP-N-acetylmuramoyl-tripeptide--D-alanyl-D-alanine ligase [Caulobacterales bacterium]
MTTDVAADQALWTSAEAVAATGGRTVGRWTASGVAIDTRELAPGDLFVALVDKRDGHAFVEDAWEKGAAAVLVDRSCGEGPQLIVRDTLEGLRGLAAAARDRSNATRVAVTGSVGKTSVKEALAVAFRLAGRAHWSERSFNNHWGAPLSLARLPRDADRAVFEMGMNHAGEIRALTGLVRPQIALITKIAPAHLENLGSMEAIADAKAEIFEGLDPWGAAVIPGDDDFAARLSERAGAAGAGWLVRFGTDTACEARLTAFNPLGDGWRGQAEIFGRRVTFRMSFGGAHWGLNAAAVLAAAYLTEVPLDLAADALAAFRPPAGRGAVLTAMVKGAPFTVIDDSYNANPSSMAAAIAALGAREPAEEGRRVAALGEMFELGPDSLSLHARLAEDIERARVDLVYGAGEGMRALLDAVPESRRGGWAADSRALAEAVASDARPGDVVLVKGSNAANMATVVEALTALDP